MVANAQPDPPAGPGNTTGAPLDPASVLVLAGAAVLKWLKTDIRQDDAV